jgi:DNA-3-methyladenine glycosylase II
VSKQSVNDAAAIEFLCKNDNKLRALIKRVGPFVLKKRNNQSSFEALANSIMRQQLAGSAATAIASRVAALGKDGDFPSPDYFLAAPDKILRGAGLSANKVLALRDLSMHTLNGTVPPMKELQRLSDQEIIDRLTVVRGIGQWTVEMILMFHLKRPDVLPLGDYGVRMGFALTYGLADLPTPQVLGTRGEKWRPYRSYASWYFWQAVHLHRASSKKAEL